jgi:hypothetical protein
MSIAVYDTPHTHTLITYAAIKGPFVEFLTNA